MAHSLFTLSGASYTNIEEHTLYELLTHNKIVDIARITKTYNGVVIALYDTTYNPDVAFFILENRHHLTYLDLRVITTMNIRTAAMAEYVCGTHAPAGPCSLTRSTGADMSRSETYSIPVENRLTRSTGADLSYIESISTPAGPCSLGRSTGATIGPSISDPQTVYSGEEAREETKAAAPRREEHR